MGSLDVYVTYFSDGVNRVPGLGLHICLGICGGPSSFMSFIGPASLSPLKPSFWAGV